MTLVVRLPTTMCTYVATTEGIRLFEETRAAFRKQGYRAWKTQFPLFAQQELAGRVRPELLTKLLYEHHYERPYEHQRNLKTAMCAMRAAAPSEASATDADLIE